MTSALRDVAGEAIPWVLLAIGFAVGAWANRAARRDALRDLPGDLDGMHPLERAAWFCTRKDDAR